MTGSDVIIDLPVTTEDTPVKQSSQCASDDGCLEISLATRTNAIQWGLQGFPFNNRSVPVANLRIATKTGVCSDADGCTLTEAATQEIFHSALFRFDGTKYITLTGDTPLTDWTGFWGATLKQSDGLSPRLLIPAAESF